MIKVIRRQVEPLSNEKSRKMNNLEEGTSDGFENRNVIRIAAQSVSIGLKPTRHE